MKKRNIKMIATLTIIASLSVNTITLHAASTSSNKKASLKLVRTLIKNNNNSKANTVFLPQTKEAAVTLWAEALKQRNGVFRFAVLDNSLKSAEYQKYSDMYWTIGFSSPWIIDYKINQKNKIDDKTYEYEINYTMTDSTRASYSAHESLTIKQLGTHWVVTKHDNYDYFPDNSTENVGSKFQAVQLPSESKLLPTDKESIVTLWAEALKQRNGSFRFAILDSDLRSKEYKYYNEMNWIIGASSHHILNYKINELKKIDNETSEYKINYTLTDSTKALYYTSENITVKANGTRWFVTKHD